MTHVASDGCCPVVENRHPREAWLHADTENTKPQRRCVTHPLPPSRRPEDQSSGRPLPLAGTHLGTCASSSTGHQAATSHVFVVPLKGTHLPVVTPTGARGTHVCRGPRFLLPRGREWRPHHGTLCHQSSAILILGFRRRPKVGTGGTWLPESRPRLCSAKGRAGVKPSYRFLGRR